MSLLVVLLFGASMGSAQSPLYHISGEKPLMYLRLPLPWEQGGVFNEGQKEKLLDGLMRSLTPRGQLGSHIRYFVKSLKQPIEVVAFTPPEKALAPVPDLVVRIRHNRDDKRILLQLKSFFPAALEANTGQDASWLKFKTVKVRGLDVEYVYFVGNLWLVSEPGSVLIYYSFSNRKFIDGILGKELKNPLSELESELKLKSDDFTLFINPQKTLEKSEIMEKGLNLKPGTFQRLGLLDLEQLSVVSQGTKNTFRFLTRLDWKKKSSSPWPKMKAMPKSTLTHVDASFYGGLNLSVLDQVSFNQLMLAFFPDENIKLPAYYRLYNSFAPLALSFSWPKHAMAPYIFLKVKDPRKFEKELKNILNPYVKFTREVSKPYPKTHILWNQNVLTYEVQKDQILFTPLIHALHDFDGKTTQRQQEDMLHIEFPVKGTTKGAYYTVMHTLLDALMASGYSVNPNFFPAFKHTQMKEEAYSGKWLIKANRNQSRTEIQVAMPYGLPGVMSGIQTDSSEDLNFLSLLLLSLHSF